MRCKHALSVGLVMALPVLFLGLRSDAGGILKGLHHCNDCDAQGTTVRLPAQQIRIETARPRVVVQNVAPSRLRHTLGYGYAYMPMMPAGPVVASFYVPGPAQEARPSTGRLALQAAHDLEIQALELARLRAAHQAEVAAINQVHQRIMSSLNASTQPAASDLNELKTEIQKLSQRISDVERLLIIHDNILKNKGKK